MKIYYINKIKHLCTYNHFKGRVGILVLQYIKIVCEIIRISSLLISIIDY